MAPVAAWTTDEGVNGVAIHIANDRAAPLRSRLRVASYRGLEVRVAEVAEPVELPGHGYARRSVEALLGHFADAAWAYRFGPPAADAIFVTLESEDPAAPISQAVRFPGGLSHTRAPAARLGLEATAEPAGDGSVTIEITTALLAYGVRVHAPGFVPDDDAFSIEPGATRRLRLARLSADLEFSGATLEALNMHGTVRAR
jgi:beta-mannosidase